MDVIISANSDNHASVNDAAMEGQEIIVINHRTRNIM